MSDSQPLRIILVDALCLVYRSYYAIPRLSTADGKPTNAVLGFVKTLQHVLKLWKPTHGLVAFDGGEDKRKTALLPEYKAQRPKMPDDLRRQLPEIEAYLEAARFPFLKMDSTEADDLIASAASLAQASSAEALIISSDKDIFQLVNEKTFVLLPSKPESRMGPDEVHQKLGVFPKQVPDFLALTGDASDNIPGVKGVGAKTAAGWLEKFGSLEGIWRNLESLDPARFRDIMRSSRADVERNMALVRLNAGVPIPFGMKEVLLGASDSARLIPFFQRMEFKTLLKDAAQPDLFGSQ